MSELLARVAEVLGGKVQGEKAKLRCPCHDDQTESLSAEIGDNGTLLLYCHAGCQYTDIKAALDSRGVTTSKQKAPKRPMQSAQPKAKLAELIHVATYEYRNEKGELVFEKLRYEPKTFRIRRPNPDGSGKWLWSLKGMEEEAPIYRLPELLEGLKDEKRWVCICEGEKDVDRLFAIGFLATTNHDGACGKGINSLIGPCRGRSVVIFEDNDEAGKKRTGLLRALLAQHVTRLKVIAWHDGPSHGDVTDYLETHSIEDLKALIKATPDEDLSQGQEEKGVGGWKLPDYEKARYEDYISFVRALPEVQDVKREFLSRELMMLSEGEWGPIANFEDPIKSYARDYGKFFTLDAFRQHLSRYAYSLKPELLISIPEWDGRDRLAEIFDGMKFGNVTDQEAYELVAEWGALMVQRLHDPGVQNRILVLVGPGGMGKDVLIESLVGGLGLYFKDLSMGGFDMTEAKRQLHTAICFRIAEFDKTGKKDTATLKEILTTKEVTERLAYDRRAASRMVRASFIASANRPRVLADDTGNRRYVVLECEDLGMKMTADEPPMGTGIPERMYPGGFWDSERVANRLQILAQFAALAKTNYRASPSARETMNRYITEQTPVNMDEIILEDWCARGAAITEPADKRHSITGEALYLYSSVAEIVRSLAMTYGVTARAVLTLLKSKGQQLRLKNARYFRFADSLSKELRNDVENEESEEF